MKKTTPPINPRLSYPIASMYGIFIYIWLIFMVNVGKYTIHGWYGICEVWLVGSYHVAKVPHLWRSPFQPFHFGSQIHSPGPNKVMNHPSFTSLVKKNIWPNGIIFQVHLGFSWNSWGSHGTNLGVPKLVSFVASFQIFSVGSKVMRLRSLSKHFPTKKYPHTPRDGLQQKASTKIVFLENDVTILCFLALLITDKNRGLFFVTNFGSLNLIS